MKEKLLAQNGSKPYEILDGKLIVNLKEPTFLDMQKAAQFLIKEGGVDLSDYWTYAFANWVESTEMSTEELLRLIPEAGKALSELLPSPEEMVEMLGFSKAKSTPSTPI